eukprot:CAMPEP_0204254916 /NCGR_PEP_ID=MMETSP0468-20130131/2871_1 /ASSEMBLY_ACC=CAM_ASM_000383 /TAXON_ID=2969 /ORGANISM="Oxyrrhis marina" /LENGTH=67 /DNA_ID=CAMNT_0051228727 /DNA_START=46 /DNA_END=249 /DNA_ORIENTATION=+
MNQRTTAHASPGGQHASQKEQKHLRAGDLSPHLQHADTGQKQGQQSANPSDNVPLVPDAAPCTLRAK